MTLQGIEVIYYDKKYISQLEKITSINLLHIIINDLARRGMSPATIAKELNMKYISVFSIIERKKKKNLPFTEELCSFAIKIIEDIQSKTSLLSVLQAINQSNRENKDEVIHYDEKYINEVQSITSINLFHIIILDLYRRGLKIVEISKRLKLKYNQVDIIVQRKKKQDLPFTREICGFAIEIIQAIERKKPIVLPREVKIHKKMPLRSVLRAKGFNMATSSAYCSTCQNLIPADQEYNRFRGLCSTHNRFY